MFKLVYHIAPVVFTSHEPYILIKPTNHMIFVANSNIYELTKMIVNDKYFNIPKELYLSIHNKPHTTFYTWNGYYLLSCLVTSRNIYKNCTTEYQNRWDKCLPDLRLKRIYTVGLSRRDFLNGFTKYNYNYMDNFNIVSYDHYQNNTLFCHAKILKEKGIYGYTDPVYEHVCIPYANIIGKMVESAPF